MLSPADFGQLFDRFTTSAFRVELLPVYDVPEEAAELAAYLATGPLPVDLGGETAWRRVLRQGREDGKQLSRVHVVHGPLSGYLRYECEWGYAFNARLGEDIRVLDLAEARAPVVLPPWDFWLLDDEIGVSLRYDSAGAYHGAELVSDEQIEELRYWRQELVTAAVPFGEYWAAHPQYHRGEG